MLNIIKNAVERLIKQIYISDKKNISSYSEEISQLKKKYLSKKNGLLIQYIKDHLEKDGASIKKLKSEVNILFDNVTKVYERKKAELHIDKVDLNLHIPYFSQGSISPLTQVTNEILTIMRRFGFSHVRDRLIEDDYHNFTALNIPDFHPARNMHDTFYLDNGKLLRTHTSTVQIRHMSQNKPPFSFVSSGPVFRYDMDATHSPMFLQIEGVLLDENVSFAHLKSFLILFLKQFFNQDNLKIRFRPSYFPFTQPSAEVDIFQNGKWLEVLGCGVIHNNVLQNLNIDKKYSGFAFGMGIDRLTMLKYNISDLRNFYSGSIEWALNNNFKV